MRFLCKKRKMKKERNEKSMNKRCIVMMLVMAVTINTATVFAQQTHTLDFITVLETPQKQNAIELTLEEATQKALTRSTTLKNNNMDLNISEQKLEDEENNIANGHTFQQLLQYIKQNADYASSKLSREVTEENVKFSLKQVYIDIINKEREIVLLEKSIQNTEKELLITKTKSKLGLISEQELQSQLLNYQKALENVQQQQMNVQTAYQSLAKLIDVDVDKNYQLILEPVYEPLEMELSLETYIKSKINTDPNIKQKQINLDTVTAEAKFTHSSVPDTVTADEEADNSVAKAELSLSDEKANLKTKIESCYDSIIKLETNYQNNLLELETLKQQLTITQKKYELQQNTELDVLKAEQSVAEKESEIISQIYEHMLLIEQFENSYLL